MVKFFTDTKLNKKKSEAEGRPIFDEVEKCEVIIAGDRSYRPVFPAHEQTVSYDKEARQDDTRTWAERYPQEYRAFKQQQTGMMVSGTPLEAWPILTAKQVAELKALDIVTVEQIAEMSERNRGALGGEGRKLIAKAKTYIEQARDAAPLNKLAADNEALRQELARLKAEQAA